MTFFVGIMCDACGLRQHAAIPRDGWGTPDGRDFCKRCYGARNNGTSNGEITVYPRTTSAERKK